MSPNWKAIALGMVVGFTAAVTPGCGPTTQNTRCNASNCAGCCDTSGQCFKGISTEACGATGATCEICASSQLCTRIDPATEFGGKCITTGTGAGDGGTGGGMGGGTGGGGGSTPDAGSCNATNCANGCCDGTVCRQTPTTAKCGRMGAACAPCGPQNTCVVGACVPCTGCIDLMTGQCNAGMTDDTRCGKNGGFCVNCTSSGQTCSTGMCTGSNTVCNASNCATGCCDGALCVQRPSMSALQCGSGTAGGACVPCSGSCDSDAGVCVGGSAGGGAGGGGGGFPFPLDGGLPGLCDPTSCPAGCCDGASLGVPAVCTQTGRTCLLDTAAALANGMFTIYTCNAGTKMCQ